ncbi:MAG: glycerophosphodiester phosphodiesterase [Rhodoferax sp.]|nr:glycerophosphodiester phosphodiesterase [Rhodoferax sp.]
MHNPFSLPLWPYPRWVAHRGAGTLAPENTLAALRVGAGYGYRMFECDVKISADGIPFLMHDTSLERSTNARALFGLDASAVGGDHSWGKLSLLDAGSWHSRTFAGEPLATLQAAAAFCKHNAYLLNIEIKPTPGAEFRTGVVVAEHAAHLWRGQTVLPLLSSFAPPALQAAMETAPAMPRALLLKKESTDWLRVARELGCCAIVCQHTLWSQDTVTQARNAGFRTMSYTVNDIQVARRLLELGLDSIITDRVDLFSPAQSL